MKLFAKEKNLGPDGWTMEFYLDFFDLFGEDISDAVEETRRQGKIHEVLNSTFLTLIPKKDRPDTFNDFHPISLYNMSYKIITKIIAERLKPYLDKFISKEQFVFLRDKQIIDDVGIAEVCLHSVKIQKKNAFLLKFDLYKDYNRLD